MVATERRNCWLTLSDLFVDNEVDYKAVAEALIRHCPSMDLQELKRTLFEEVAPVLGTNGLTPAPSVWIEFDSDEVIRDVSERLARQRRSLWHWMTGRLWNVICRWLFGSIWADLERELVAAGKT